MFSLKTNITQINSSGDSGANTLSDISTRALQSVTIGQGASTVNAGSGTVIVGYNAGFSMSGSSFTTAIGFSAGSSATISTYSVLLGAYAGQTHIGTESVFIGAYCGQNAQSVSQTVGVGAYSFSESDYVVGGVAVGYRAGSRMLTGSYSTLVGNQSGENARYADFSTMVGHQSGRACFNGTENSYVGAFSGYSNSTGGQNSLVGVWSGGYLVDSIATTSVGAYSLAYGHNSYSNVAIGFGAASLGGGTGNCFIGADVSPYCIGSGNCIIGYKTGPTLTTGGCNVLIGFSTDVNFENINYSIAIGTQTLANNYTISIGSVIQNVRLNSTIIGFNMYSDSDNSILVGNSINIESVTYFKDPLNYSLVNTVLADANTKFGISNIVYSQTLVNTLTGDQYTNAIATAITSNKYSDQFPINNPGLSNFNLLSYLPNWAIVQGENSNSISGSNILSNTTFIQGKTYSANSYIYITPLTFSTNVTQNIIGSSSNIVNYVSFNPSPSNMPIVTISNYNFSLSNSIYGYCSNSSVITSNLPIGNWIYITTIYPQFGTVSGNFNSTFTYSPFIDSACANSDSFTVTPVTIINDSYGLSYGLANTNSNIVVNLNFGTSYYVNSNLGYIVGNNTNYITQNSILITPYPAITSNIPFRPLSIDSNVTINGYTSNMIASMIQNSIDSYPPSLFSYCNIAVQSNLTVAINTCNLVYTPYVTNISYAIQSFSNFMTSEPTTLSNVWSQFTSSFISLNSSNLWISYSNLVQQWTYGIAYSNTSNLLNSNLLFSNSFFPTAWSNSSNLISFSNSFTSVTSNGVPPPEISSLYSNIQYYYFKVPRLFLSYSDIVNSNVYITISSNLLPTYQFSPIQFILNSNYYNKININLYNQNSNLPVVQPIYTVYLTKQFAYSLPQASFTIPYNSNIQTVLPNYGLFWNSNTNFQSPIINTGTQLLYQSTNPYVFYDSARLTVYNNNSNITNVVYVNIINSNVGHINSPIVNTVAPLVYNTTNTNNGVLQSSSWVTSLSNYCTFNITSNFSSFINPNVITTFTTYTSNTPIITYNYLNGYQIITSNITSNVFVTGNVGTSVIQSYNATNLIITGNSRTYVTSSYGPITFTNPNITSNIIITITGYIITSNIFALTSNVQTVVYDVVDYTHYDGITSNLLFSSNTSNTVSWATSNYSLYTGTLPTITNYTSNLIQNSNVSIYEQVFQLSPYYMFSSNSYYTGSAIMSNVGIINSWYQSNINSGAIYIKTPPGINTYSYTADGLNCNILVTTYQISNYPYYQTVNSNCNIVLTSNINTAITNFINFGVNSNIVIVSSSNGVIINNKTYWRTGNYNTDTINYFYTVNSLAISPLYSQQFGLITDPILPITVNNGIDNIPSILSSRNFYIARSNVLPDNTIITTNGLILPHTFTMRNIINNQIVIKRVQTVTPISYTVNNDPNSYNISIQPYLFNYFSGSNIVTSNTLYISTLGNSSLSNTVVGPNYFGTIYDGGSNIVSPSNIQYITVIPPAYGTLVFKTYNDLLNNGITYMSYNSNIVQNDTITGFFSYSNISGPIFTTTIKNYRSVFTPFVVDPTRIGLAGRTTILPLSLTYGLVQDNYNWSSNSVIVPYSNSLSTLSIPLSLSNIKNDIYVVPEIPFSYSPIVINSSLSTTIDIADSLYLTPILSQFTSNSSARDILIWVSTPPKYGTIINTASNLYSQTLFNTNLGITGTGVSLFNYNDIVNNYIRYQHLGQNLLSDSFVLTISSQQYDYNIKNSITVTVMFRQMPYVVTNSIAYNSFKTLSSASNTINSFSNNLVLSSSGYLHIVSQNNVYIPGNLTTFTTSSGFQYPSSLFTCNFPYPVSTLQLAVNSTSNVGHINPLAFTTSIYSTLFLTNWSSIVNQYYSSNTLYSVNSNQQIISYIFDPTQTQYEVLNGHIVNFEVLVQPYNYYAYNATYPSLITSQLSYDFTIGLGSSNLFRFYNNILYISINNSYSLTTIATLNWNTFNNILIINSDPNNSYNCSLYLQYDDTKNYQQNIQYNILYGKSVPSLDLSTVTNFFIVTNINNSSNFITSSNYINYNNQLPFYYSFSNIATEMLFEDVQISSSTYKIENSNLNVSTANNIALGSNVIVRGTNNICIGNNFTTSGLNSIILGNDIGISTILTSSVNDIYQSIVIANSSFQNSIVRNIIAIGNSLFNDLSTIATIDVNTFLSKYPIIIGNNIDSTKLDFNINIDNVFLKTIVGGNQIYLGLGGERVCIGYTSNVQLSSGPTLNVVGGISVDYINLSGENYYTPCNIQMGYVMAYQQQLNGVDYIVTTNTNSNTGLVGVVNTVSPLTIKSSGVGYIWTTCPVIEGALLTSSVYSGIAQPQTGVNSNIWTNYTIAKALQTVLTTNTSNLIRCLL